jgi:hypothetical protein
MGGLLSKQVRTRSTARAKLTQEFVERLAADFQVYGEEVIQKLREGSPAIYAQVIAKLCPQELLVTESEHPELADMSFDELRDFLIEGMHEVWGVEISQKPSPVAITTDGKA